ncbi:MAG: hypothetical protein Q7R65_02580 [bacterium]|nr:hypothetical protein [bacterium]
MKNETALEEKSPRPATPGQLNEIYSLLPKGVPTELSFETANAIIGNKGAFIEKVTSLFPDPAILKDQVKQWEHFYREVFGITEDCSQVKLPPRKEGFNRLIVVVKGLTHNQVYDTCTKSFRCWRYSDDLNTSVTKNDRDSNRDGTYAIWVRDAVEADEELKNLSANDIKKQNIKGVTLLERMLHELKYFLETGKHLDIENVTLCTGSRDSGDGVPDAYWCDGRFRVYWCHPDDADSGLRARETVTL